jgi:hypothetical protein
LCAARRLLANHLIQSHHKGHVPANAMDYHPRMKKLLLAVAVSLACMPAAAQPVLVSIKRMSLDTALKRRGLRGP